MSKNIDELGKLLNAQMKRAATANQGISVELGSINSNMALVVGSLNNAIPQGEYMISLRLTLPKLLFETKETDTHTHEAELPEQLRPVQAGDRVVVAWVGTEPVVVDIVVSS